MTSVMTTKSTATGLDTVFDVSVGLELPGYLNDAVEVNIHRVSAGLIELLSPIYLKLDQKLELVYEGRRLPSRVSYCKRHQSGDYIVAVRTARDFYIRTESRIPIDLVTKLRILGSPTAVSVRVVNLSPCGLGLELSMAIPIGARASVNLGQRTASGEVAHCAGKADHYRAGVRLENLLRSDNSGSSVWTDLNSGAENGAALAAFFRAIEQRQSRSVAIVSSLLRR